MIFLAIYCLRGVTHHSLAFSRSLYPPGDHLNRQASFFYSEESGFTRILTHCIYEQVFGEKSTKLDERNCSSVAYLAFLVDLDYVGGIIGGVLLEWPSDNLHLYV